MLCDRIEAPVTDLLVTSVQLDMPHRNSLIFVKIWILVRLLSATKVLHQFYAVNIVFYSGLCEWIKKEMDAFNLGKYIYNIL